MATYELQRLADGRWTRRAFNEHVRYLGAGQEYLRLPRINFLPTAGLGLHFRVVIGVAWGTPSGRPVGARSAFLFNRGDYVCRTPLPCEVGNGWVWLRSPGT